MKCPATLLSLLKRSKNGNPLEHIAIIPFRFEIAIFPDLEIIFKQENINVNNYGGPSD